MIFEQMALQGQSVFGAAGDTGAFACIRSDGTTIVNVDDPSAQPWVTSVGGTSLESFNPERKSGSKLPEQAWRRCGMSITCATRVRTKAASPDSSGAPDRRGRRRQQPILGPSGLPVWAGHHEPLHDVWQWHDAMRAGGQGSRAAKFRTSPPTPTRTRPTRNTALGTLHALSVCATISGANPPGWFGIGGTSLSSPLWSAIIANHDGL